MTDFGTFRQPKARKRYVCEHCRCAIEVGEKHLAVSGRFEGDFYSYREHLDCYEASGAFYQNAGLLPDDDRPWLYELGEEDASDIEWLAENYPSIHSRMEARRAATKVAA